MADPRNLPYPPAPSGLELGYGVNPVTHQPPQYPAPESLGFAQQPLYPHPVAPAPTGQVLGHGVNPVTHQPPQYPAPESLGFAQQPPFPHPVAPAPVGQGMHMVQMGSTPFGTSGLAILSQVRIRHNRIHYSIHSNGADKLYVH